jgi:hypothetical protein
MTPHVNEQSVMDERILIDWMSILCNAAVYMAMNQASSMRARSAMIIFVGARITA